MMKQLAFKSVLFVLILTLAAGTGCGLLPADDKGGQLKSGDEKQAIETLAEFGIVNELATLKLLEIFSDGFTQPLFGDMVIISNEDYNALFDLMDELGAYQERVTASLSLLLPPELAGRYKLVYAGIAPPASREITQPPSSGLFGSFLEFFGFLGDAGKRSRERIVSISRNMNDTQKSQLYEELRPEWKNQASDYNEWFTKLQSGDFDNKASQIHNDFTQNPDLDFYTDTAQANGALPDKIVYEEGGEMIEKGSQFYAEVATTVVGKSLPGFDKGVEKVKDLNEKAEKFKKYTEKYYGEGISGAVEEAVKNKFQEMGADAAGKTFGAEIGNAVTGIVETLAVEKTPDKGEVTIGPQADGYGNIVFFNKGDDTQVKMFTYTGDAGTPAVFNLPEGQYFAVASGENRDDYGKSENVRVNGGGEAVVTFIPAVSPVTESTPAAKPSATAAATAAPTGKGEYPRDGKWVIRAVPDKAKFTTDDGTTFNCDSFEIQFQVQSGKILKMHSPRYSYISEDYASGRGKVTLDSSGVLKVEIDKDMIEGRLGNSGGSGTWVSVLAWNGKDYDDNRGTWTAERTGN